MTIEHQLRQKFGLNNPACTNLNTPANDVVLVTVPDGTRYALKLYNAASRSVTEVRWELDLTLHLLRHDAPVAKPIAGNGSYLHTFELDGHNRAAMLFEWAPGEKPQPDVRTYELLGAAAARIHAAADSFRSDVPRERYDLAELIDDQLRRMHQPLVESGQLQRVVELTDRMRTHLENPNLDWGVCHIDLTLDNVHRDGDALTVFDFDSAGESWRAIEAWGIRKFSEEYFQAWLQGYRSVRAFSAEDERAVSVFGIVGDLRNIVWKLGYAKSSRGKPLMQVSDLPGVVDGWVLELVELP